MAKKTQQQESQPDNQVIFTGFRIRTIDVRRDEGGIYVRVNASSDYTSPIRERMLWQEFDDSTSYSGLKGNLVGDTIRLVPNEREIADKEITLDRVQKVFNFEFHRVKDGEDDTLEELRFQMLIHSRGAAGKLEKYWSQNAELSQAVLKLGATQSEMEPGTDAEGSIVED